VLHIYPEEIKDGMGLIMAGHYQPLTTGLFQK